MNQPVVLRAADRVAVPWKNGGGVTREIAVHLVGNGFEWRISMAEVATAGPFSCFEGIDRILLVLDGVLDLELPSGTVRLGIGQSIAFDGEAAVTGMPVGGTVTDLNIMVRRGLWRAAVETLQCPQGALVEPHGECILIFAGGAIVDHDVLPQTRHPGLEPGSRFLTGAKGEDALNLEPGDAIRLDSATGRVAVTSDDAVHLVRLYRSGAPSPPRLSPEGALAGDLKP